MDSRGWEMMPRPITEGKKKAAKAFAASRGKLKLSSQTIRTFRSATLCQQQVWEKSAEKYNNANWHDVISEQSGKIESDWFQSGFSSFFPLQSFLFSVLSFGDKPTEMIKRKEVKGVRRLWRRPKSLIAFGRLFWVSRIAMFGPVSRFSQEGLPRSKRARIHLMRITY